MTNAVERMMKEYGVEYQERYNSCKLNLDGECKNTCDICEHCEEKYCYPPFTAEKQIELIEYLSSERIVKIAKGYNNYDISFYTSGALIPDLIMGTGDSLKIALANLMRKLYKANAIDTTKVKEILER